MLARSPDECACVCVVCTERFGLHFNSLTDPVVLVLRLQQPTRPPSHHPQTYTSLSTTHLCEVRVYANTAMLLVSMWLCVCVCVVHTSPSSYRALARRHHRCVCVWRTGLAHTTHTSWCGAAMTFTSKHNVTLSCVSAARAHRMCCVSLRRLCGVARGWRVSSHSLCAVCGG